MARRALSTVLAAAGLAGCLSVPERDLPAYAGPTGVSPDAAGGGAGGGGGGGDLASATDARTRDARPGAPDAEMAVSPDGGVTRDGGLSVDGGVASADDVGPSGPDVPCTAAPEQCNGLDDDCDGAADEGDLSAVCYSGPAETLGRGMCHGGVQRCVAGAPGPCEGEQAPAREDCNGLDDDCNGAIDDDGAGHPAIQVCYDGPIETEGVGPCLAGFQRCEGAAWGACRGQVLPFGEVCDGVDDDCDGQIDEDAGQCGCAADERRGCYAGPEGTAGVGLCRAGEQVCDGSTSTFGRCEGEVRPTGEVCNGLDDDCNGAVDDALPGVGAPCSVESGACRSDGVTGCDPGSGNLVCRAPPVSPVDERCDGRDDDCDGRVDEGFGVGGPCTVGTGACARGGAVVCVGVGAVCDAAPGAPADEVCNGGDDDCDGATDEAPGGGVILAPCQIPGGPCPDGIARCEGGVFGACAPAGAAEICDGRDNNCDGRVDEDLPGCEGCNSPGNLRRCLVPPPGEDGVGVCRHGSRVCLPEGVWSPCRDLVVATDEVCDAEDDDCDGAVDEGLQGPACSAGEGACRVEGPTVCRNGQFVCELSAGGGPEVCNGLDEDCDGRADEDFTGVGTPCGVGQGACYADGVVVCDSNGQFTCTGRPGSPSDETCDAIDNDCDGRADETFPMAGEGCDTGNPAPDCRFGNWACFDGVTVCDFQSTREFCDGIDNDCDGAVDEDFFPRGCEIP
jgi:hypothetical protein